MSNGKFALAKKQKENANETALQDATKKDAFFPKMDMIGRECARFITIPFAIFVGFLEFFSAGFEHGLRKALAYLEEGRE